MTESVIGILLLLALLLLGLVINIQQIRHFASGRAGNNEKRHAFPMTGNIGWIVAGVLLLLTKVSENLLNGSNWNASLFEISHSNRYAVVGVIAVLYGLIAALRACKSKDVKLEDNEPM